MLTVSRKEFAANPFFYIDKEDTGSGVTIRRGARQKVVLTPATRSRNQYDEVELRAKREMSPYQFKTWLRYYRAIPPEYRCNPFDIIEDGDYFYADKRNIEEMEKYNRAYEEDKRAGNLISVSNKEELHAFLDSL
ncbi:MAG: hypothetical protein LBM61_03110 [Prevotellaceae bacterium]|jgi:hypothetical protein|nr:hypothetical protein [Prevotellaceae bacterium]